MRMVPLTGKSARKSNDSGYQSSSIGRLQANLLTSFRTGELPRLGTQELLAGYAHFPWLRAVTSKIAEIMSSVDWYLMVNGKRVDQHPLLDVITNGNELFPGVIMRQMTSKYYCIVGDCYLLKERNRFGIPIYLWPIPAHWVKRLPLFNDGKYLIQFAGVYREIEASEIIRIYDPDLEMPYSRGTGVGGTLGDELETDEFAAAHLKMYFKNNARPDILVASDDPETPITEEAAKRMEKSWVDKLQGFMKAHKPFFLPGKVAVTQLGSSLKDMQMLDLRKFERDVVLQTFGLPPEALGILENSNRATINSAQFFLTKHVAVPKLEVMRAFFQQSLVPDFVTNPAKINSVQLRYESPVQEDNEFILSTMRAAPWAFTVDETRDLVGFQELPDGEGDIFVTPLNMLFSDKPGGGLGNNGSNTPGDEAGRKPKKIAEMVKDSFDLNGYAWGTAELAVVRGSDEVGCVEWMAGQIERSAARLGENLSTSLATAKQKDWPLNKWLNVASAYFHDEEMNWDEALSDFVKEPSPELRREFSLAVSNALMNSYGAFRREVNDAAA